MIDGTSTLHDSELIDCELPMTFKHSDTLKPFKTNVQENEKLKAMYKEFYEAYAKNKKTIVEVSDAPGLYSVDPFRVQSILTFLLPFRLMN